MSLLSVEGFSKAERRLCNLQQRETQLINKERSNLVEDLGKIDFVEI